VRRRGELLELCRTPARPAPPLPPPRGRGNQLPGWMGEQMQKAVGTPALLGGVFFSLFLS
jgi:hypothetical protein